MEKIWKRSLISKFWGRFRNTATYDRPDLMDASELEIAWLGSIWENPEHCRKYGLYGLDRSYFHSDVIFDIGHEMLRDENFTSRTPTDSMFDVLMNQKLIGKLEKASLNGVFIPAFYKPYCEALAVRVDFAC